MLKIKAKVAYAEGGEPWEEEWTTPEGFPSIQAQAVINKFNATLRPHERARRLIEVVSFVRVADQIEHDWHKISLVTESGGYDRMRCERCGATGKRYGLGQQGVKLDPRQPQNCRKDA